MLSLQNKALCSEIEKKKNEMHRLREALRRAMMRLRTKEADFAAANVLYAEVGINYNNLFNLISIYCIYII